jgi:hypothetical protein
VHLPLNNINFPVVVQVMFENLISVVTFDVLESLEEIGFGLEYDASPTSPYNAGFDTLGYSTSEPIDLLGTINFLFAIIVIQILWFFTPRRFCCKNFKRQQGDSLSNGLIRFAIQMTFELFICIGAVLYPREGPTLLNIEEKASFDSFLIGYTITIAILTFGFLIFACVVTLFCTKKSVILTGEIRLKEGKPLIDEVERAINDKKARLGPTLTPLRKLKTLNKSS